MLFHREGSELPYVAMMVIKVKVSRLHWYAEMLIGAFCNPCHLQVLSVLLHTIFSSQSLKKVLVLTGCDNLVLHDSGTLYKAH